MLADIQLFNEHYLNELWSMIQTDRSSAVQLFGAEICLIDTIHNTSKSDLSRLITNDCTLVRQNFTDSMLELHQSGIQTGEMGVIQNLNYKYLMLLRHIASRNIREAMLRTGVEKGVAEKVAALTAYDIKNIALQSTSMFGKCHLTVRAVKAATASNFDLDGFITMLSMRKAVPCTP